MDRSQSWVNALLDRVSEISHGHPYALLLLFNVLTLIFSFVFVMNGFISINQMFGFLKESLIFSVIMGALIYLYIKQETQQTKYSSIKTSELVDSQRKSEEWRKKLFSSRIRHFFEILEKHGIRTLEEIEDAIMSQTHGITIIMESGEGLLGYHEDMTRKSVSSAVGKYLVEKYFQEQEVSPTSIFKVFVYSKIKLQRKVYKLSIPGTSAFLVMLEKDENASVFGQELIEQYANFVITELKEFQRSKYYQQLGSKEQKYLIEWMQSFAPPYNPKIIISYPYQSNLLELTEFVPEDEREEIIHNLKEIVRQKIEITQIKFSYFFEASGYDSESFEEVLEEISRMDLKIKQKISGKKIMMIKDFLARQNPYEDLIEAIKVVTPEVYHQLNQYPEYLQELKCLIYDLKMLLSGKLDFNSEM